MSGKVFTSSNGYVFSEGDIVTLTGPEGDELIRPGGHIGKALKEYVEHVRVSFRAEEDERLGRWRWPADPGYIVYPLTEGVVAVVEEKNGTSDTFTRGQWVSSPHGEAAHDYFDAHPEPKPWHDATAEAHRRYNGDTIIDENTGEPTSHDDWGYSECQRQAFIAGAEWARS